MKHEKKNERKYPLKPKLIKFVLLGIFYNKTVTP